MTHSKVDWLPFSRAIKRRKHALGEEPLVCLPRVSSPVSGSLRSSRMFAVHQINAYWDQMPEVRQFVFP